MYVRIAVVDTSDLVQAYLDNSAPESMHYYDDELHMYLSGTAHTFSFKTDARHPDSEYLTVGNRLVFRWKEKDYYLNIMNSVRDEDTVEIQAFSLTFELLNEYVGPYSASQAMTFEGYLDVFDPEGTIELGNNEVQGKSVTNEWTGTDTILNRLLSLANVFDAEIEFIPKLNNNYTLEKLVMNVYQEHSEDTQGIGTDRPDIILRYGVDVEGITKTSDATELFTAIRPTGTEGLTISSLEKEVLDEDGNVEFYTESGSDTIYAPLARNRIPSNTLSAATDRYIVKVWTYETENVNTLYGQALAQLKANCDPQVSYSVEGFFDLEIGDTVRIYDEEFNPPLYLSARVSEQIISFTDPSRCRTTMGNFVELESGIDPELLARMQVLIEQNKAYVCTISSDNGIVFKNGTGTTTLTAVVRDNGADVTDNFTIKWYIDGLEVSSGKTIMVDASTLSGSAVYRFDALNAAGVVKGSCEVTVTSVEDGAPGSAGISITNVEIQYYKSTSQTELAGGEWVTEHPELEKGTYIWEKTVVTYSNGTTTETLPVNTTLEVNNLLADYATVENLNATNAVIASLSGDLSSFQTSVTQELLAAKGWMAEGSIGSAQISDLNANKIRSGTLDTAVVTVAGSDGRLQIADNTLQISDTERVRVQIGKDASGDYTLAVWDAEGKLIWDALGATENTIQRAIIRDSMVAGDAGIQALKIDFQSFETALTDQGLTISGTVIQVGSKTLDVVLSEQSQAISDQQETLTDHWAAIQANQESIALKVSSQEFTSYKSTVTAEISTAKNEAVSTAAADAADKADQALSDAKTYTTAQITTVNNHLSTVDSSISALQGEIELKVEQTDIDSAVTEMEGYTDNKLSGYSTTTQMTAAINAKADEITATVSSTYATRNSLTGVENRLTAAEATISQQSDEIDLRVKETDITGNYLIGKINLSSTTATIEASHINLNGAVTISSLASDTKDRLDSAVSDVKVYYALSSSPTTAPASGWSTTAPAWTDGKYMWQKTVTVNSGGETIESAPTCISGATGKSGTDGANGTSVTVTSTSVTYQVSASGTTTPTGAWSSSVPSTSAGQYLWTKTVVNYSDGKSTTAYSVSRNGSNGTNGTNGSDGKGIKSTAVTYQAGSSQTTAPTSTWSSSVPALSASKPYLWTRTIVTYTDNTTSTSYSVSSTLESFEIGGRNLLLGTGTSKSTTYTGVTNDTGSTLISYNFSDYALTKLEDNKIVTISFDWSASGTLDGRFHIQTAYNHYTMLTGEYIYISQENSSGHFEKTVTINTAIDFTMIRVIGAESHSTLTIRNLKIEIGNKATDWSPAPEDVDSSITTAQTTADNALTNAATAQSTANTANNRATYHYGTCSTAAATAAKVVTLSGFSLYTGATVSVYFTYANTASSPTLNVNSTGAKTIRVQNANITAAYYWAAKDTVTFIYNGTYWVMAESSAKTNIANWCYNNNTTYIDGGSIYAKSIKAAQIDVDDLFAQSITAKKMTLDEGCRIGGMRIGVGMIYNDLPDYIIHFDDSQGRLSSELTYNGLAIKSIYTANPGETNVTMDGVTTTGDFSIVNSSGTVQCSLSELNTVTTSGYMRKCGKVVIFEFRNVTAATLVNYTIPSGYRPPANLSFPVLLQNSNSNYFFTAFIQVLTNGSVSGAHFDYGTTATWFTTSNTSYLMSGRTSWIIN